MTNEVYEPSPDEIAAACRSIRSTWSATEMIARRDKTPPLIKADYVGIEAAAAVRLEDKLEATLAAMKA